MLVAVGVWFGRRWRSETAAPAASSDASSPGLPFAAPPAAAPGGEDDADDPLTPRHHGRNPWAAVDLEEVRAALPNNTFWRMAAPTTDPEVLRAREEERQRWNVEYGKVLSNTATKEEVDAYFAHRQQMSTDYIQFAAYLLKNYWQKLGTRNEGLLKLAIKLHLARLEEIPRQMAEANQRREAHEAARRAWLEEQKAFEADPPPPAEPAAPADADPP